MERRRICRCLYVGIALVLHIQHVFWLDQKVGDVFLCVYVGEYTQYSQLSGDQLYFDWADDLLWLPSWAEVGENGTSDAFQPAYHLEVPPPNADGILFLEASFCPLFQLLVEPAAVSSAAGTAANSSITGLWALNTNQRAYSNASTTAAQAWLRSGCNNVYVSEDSQLGIVICYCSSPAAAAERHQRTSVFCILHGAAVRALPLWNELRRHPQRDQR